MVVMAADHAHEQGEQQKPAEGRKHALNRTALGLASALMKCGGLGLLITKKPS
jgi:hypothetical protein